MIATKVALEMIILHPMGLLAYFGTIGLLQQGMDAYDGGDNDDGVGNRIYQSMTSITKQVQRDFWPTLALEIVLWTPLDVINFALVPVRHQLLVVNCGCLVESILLSYIQHNGVPSFSFS